MSEVLSSSKAKLVNALTDLVDALNVLGGDNSKLVQEVFSRTHRTLQQEFVKVVILPVLVHLAERYEQGNYDLRNQAAAEMAHKMIKAVPEQERYLPLI